MCIIHSKSGRVRRLRSRGQEGNGHGHKVKRHERSKRGGRDQNLGNLPRPIFPCCWLQPQAPEGLADPTVRSLEKKGLTDILPRCPPTSAPPPDLVASAGLCSSSDKERKDKAFGEGLLFPENRTTEAGGVNSVPRIRPSPGRLREKVSSRCKSRAVAAPRA